MPEPHLDLFAVCLPGLESMVTAELRDLGFEGEPDAGGVALQSDDAAVARINLRAGLVSHLLIRISEFGARSLQDLDVRGARIDWTKWLPPGTPTTVKARCRRSRIYHSGAAEERIEKHLRAQLGEPGDGEPIAIRVRIQDNRCTISLDSSGAPLHRRGWRLDPGPAPLREDLARALVIASGWDRESPLLDPMMGSGTILIEAATLALGLAPGRLRSFAFERFVGHDVDKLAAMRAAPTPSNTPRLVGSDKDEAALKRATANAARAGVLDHLDLRTSPVSEADDDLDLSTCGALVTNPPYGKRLGDAQALAKLYRSLGELAGRLPTARIAIAASDRRLALRTGLPLTSAFLADSGGLKIRALCTGPRA